MATLSAELRTWLRPGLAGTIASIDRSGQPQLARVWAVRAHAGRDVIEVYVQRSSAQAVVESLEGGGRAALNLIEVHTYRSRMFKGVCDVSKSEASAEFLAENLLALNRAFVGVGMQADGAEAMLSHSDEPYRMVALELAVETVFDQSPKPGAGARL